MKLLCAGVLFFFLFLLWPVLAADIPEPDYTRGGTIVIDSPTNYDIVLDCDEFMNCGPVPEIHWQGRLVVEHGESIYVVTDAEIGLRDDGVVVWREVG